MIIQNNPANRKLVRQLSDFLSKRTSYFKASIDSNWNLGEDIRFEISSVGLDNPVIISTAYTPAGGFWFKVRVLQSQLATTEALLRLRFRISDAETILLGIRPLIEDAHPKLSEIE